MRRRSWIAGLVLVALIAAGVGLWLTRRADRGPVRIATAGRGGTYYPLGVGLAEAIERDLGVEAEALETGGSVDNFARLAAGECELALVQNDTPSQATVHAIAPIYPEVLHLVVREGIDDFEALRGHRVAGGAEGSGTARLVDQVLRHFELRRRVRVAPLSTGDAVAAFERGEIDGVFLVSGLRSAAVDELLHVHGAHLLGLGPSEVHGSRLEGFQVNFPFVHPAVIPQGAYGAHPPEAVGTLGVEAVLVARPDLDRDLVHDIAQTLHRNRVTLMRHHKASRHITEQFDPSDLRFALHPGAEAYLRRDEPTFLQRYGAALSFSMAALMALISALVALRRRLSSTRRARIEDYYGRLRAAVEPIAEADDDELARIATTLRALRRAAFADLVAEELEADQSFSIFTDTIATELAEIERRQA